MKKPDKIASKLKSKENIQPKKMGEVPPSVETAFPAFFLNTRLQSFLIFAFAFLLYANTLGHQWTLDDNVVITENTFTKQGVSGIKGIFSNDTFFGYLKKEGKVAFVSGGRYRPLTLVAFAVVYQIFGLNPFPFHLLTVTLFAFTCLLLYRVLLLMLRNYKGKGYAEITAWMTALLFAAHPVHTEAIANIKGCDEIVTLLGSLGALYLSLKAVDTGKTGYNIAAACALFLGLLAKENAVTFLVVIPLALIFFRKAAIPQLMKTGIPLLAAFAVFFAIRWAVLPELFSKPPVELINNSYLKWVDSQWIDFTTEEKYSTIFYTLGQYIRLLFLPVTLTHDYYPRHIGIMYLTDPQVLISIFLYVFMAGYALWQFWKGKRDLPTFGILFYLFTLSIVSNLVFPIGTNMGERFLFMPSIGFCLVLTAFLIKFFHSPQEHGINLKKITLPLIVFGVIVTLFSIKTALRNKAWYDNRTLAFTDINTSTNSAKIHSVCGFFYTEDGMNETTPTKKAELFQRSIEHNSKALEIHPTFKTALYYRGVAYHQSSRYDEAIADLSKVLKIDPNDPKGITNLSFALCEKAKIIVEKKDFAGALQLLNESIELNPTNEQAIWYLGVVHANMGQYPEAINRFNQFTEIRPNDPAAWGGLEWAYNLAGNSPKAAECRAKIQQLK